MIVDDHKMMREGIRQLLELDGDIKVIAEAKDGLECMDCLSVEQEKKGQRKTSLRRSI